jgi:AraC family transcriptional regulator
MAVASSEATRREYAARINRVVDYIQSHLADPLDLERLAAVACFSPFHFHRLFHAWMGETLQDFVHRLRLERAAQLLLFNPLTSISEIALECGFSSSSAFARAFKGAFRRICKRMAKAQDLSTDSQASASGRRGFSGILKTAGPQGPR